MRLYLNKQCLIGQRSEQKRSHLCHLVLQASSFVFIYIYTCYAIEIWFSHSSANVSLGSQVYEPCWAQVPLKLQVQLTWGGYSAKEYSSVWWGRFDFSAELSLTNSEARVSLILVSVLGSTQEPEGDSDTLTVIAELPRPPG